jgi:hypothetical protein
MRPTVKGFHPEPLHKRYPQWCPQEGYDTRRHCRHRCQNAGLLPAKTFAHTHKLEHPLPPSLVFRTRSGGCCSRRIATTKVSRCPLLATQMTKEPNHQQCHVAHRRDTHTVHLPRPPPRHPSSCARQMVGMVTIRPPEQTGKVGASYNLGQQGVATRTSSEGRNRSAHRTARWSPDLGLYARYSTPATRRPGDEFPGENPGSSHSDRA